ncbi:hypothetical protein BJV74DRAFT_953946 [Russula compacta]|nr:hypothetical protein BJV74DRAFT_953946 [Russula compacta]
MPRGSGAAGEMSCVVINPTLQSVFPHSLTLMILRTLNTSLTPQPNSTSFGPSGSAYAQLWYDGVDQFYCAATGCSQRASLTQVLRPGHALPLNSPVVPLRHSAGAAAESAAVSMGLMEI